MGALLAALIALAPSVYAAGSDPAIPANESKRPPPDDDLRLPQHPIKSPGFPSELDGKCRTAQDCAAYCKKHPSEPGCKKPPDHKPAS